MRIGIEAQRVFRKKKHGMDIVILEVLKQLQQMQEGNEYVVYAQPDNDMDALQQDAHLTIEATKKDFILYGNNGSCQKWPIKPMCSYCIVPVIPHLFFQNCHS